MLYAVIGILAARGEYRRWSRKLCSRLDAGSTVIPTARGPIEYATSGTGPPLLIAHGMSGGYDQGCLLARVLGISDRFRVVAPSRPGYLRTPLSVGRSPAEQADAYATLLDVLHLPTVAVVGFSGGGPSALQFALRHPDRCAALVLISALSHPFQRARSTPVQRALGATIKTVRRAPAFTWIVSRSLLILPISIAGNNAEGRFITRALWSSILPGAARDAGVRNDDAQWDVMQVYDLAAIVAPTLVIHGTADGTVRPEMGAYAARTIPGAGHTTIDGGTHLSVFRRRGEVSPEVQRFLSAYTADQSGIALDS